MESVTQARRRRALIGFGVHKLRMRGRAAGPSPAACIADPAGLTSTGPSSITALTVDRLGRTNVSLLAVWALAANRAWAGGQAGVILGWNGTDWRLETTPTQETIVGIWAADSNSAYASASGGVLLHRVGSQWVAEPSGVSSTVTLLDVWGLDRDRVWAVGSNGTVLRRTAAGWTPMSVPLPAEIWGIWGTSEDALVAVGQNGVILECCDAGVWHSVPSPTNPCSSPWPATAPDESSRLVVPAPFCCAMPARGASSRHRRRRIFSMSGATDRGTFSRSVTVAGCSAAMAATGAWCRPPARTRICAPLPVPAAGISRRAGTARSSTTRAVPGIRPWTVACCTPSRRPPTGPRLRSDRAVLPTSASAAAGRTS